MRFQLALNVRSLDEAIPYYEKLLGAPVNKRKPGYANFAVESPPLKLVLFERPDAAERLDHVGFEMSGDEVGATHDRLAPLGLADRVILDETCCYAKKSTVYAHDPQGLMWEFYLFRGDSETFGADPQAAEPEPAAEARAGAATAGCC